MFQRQQKYLDDLNRALLIAALVLSIIGLFFFKFGSWPRYVVTGLAAALLILLVLRMFSKDTSKRYRENMKYLTVVTAIGSWFKRTFSRSASAAPRSKRTARARRERTRPGTRSNSISI